VRELDSIVKPGDVLAGKYRVERVLGAGGMGVVVAAHHLQLDERVALKFLLPEARADAATVARFEREARAAVKIKSEHVARVIDVGVMENGAPYIVMEYLEGSDLSDWLLANGSTSPAQAADFVIQACEALVEAHALGIVHRDLKPSNLFCVRRLDGVSAIKVLDFGISKAAFGPSADMTRSQSLLGSPLYMSPEQMEAPKSVDARTDIWSLGIILYELITRHVPFDGETLPELILKIVSQQPPSPRSLRPEVPEAFERIIARCLEKDRTKRYRHVGELAEALGPFAPPRCATSVERISRIAGSQAWNAPEAVSPRHASTQLLAPNPRLTPVPLGPPPGTPPPGAHLPRVDSVPVPPSSPFVVRGSTASSWGSTSGVIPPSTGRGKMILAGVGAAIGLVALLGFAATRSSTRTSALAPPAAREASAPVLALPEPSATVATAASADPVPAPSASVRVPSPPSVRTAAPPPRPAPSTAAADCKVPFVFDTRGTKIFKPECL
jgi:serine/threonine protein kinase